MYKKYNLCIKKLYLNVHTLFLFFAKLGNCEYYINRVEFTSSEKGKDLVSGWMRKWV